MKLVARACGRFGGLAALVCAGVGAAVGASGGTEGPGMAVMGAVSAALGLWGGHVSERSPGFAGLLLLVATGPVALVFVGMGVGPRQPSMLLWSVAGLSAVFLFLGSVFSLANACIATRPPSA